MRTRSTAAGHVSPPAAPLSGDGLETLGRVYGRTAGMPRSDYPEEAWAFLMDGELLRVRGCVRREEEGHSSMPDR